jgi:hypothetical protein
MGDAGQAGEAGGTAGQAGGEGTQQGGGYPGAENPGAESGQGQPGGYGAIPGGRGPLTPAEQVAILDAQLEQGTGEFDAMILEEQQAQRQAARERPAPTSTSAPEPASSGGGGAYGGDASYESEVAGGGGYSGGGGMGGASKGGQIPQNTAKYPPPADIPDGNDDDVVARQLREAAMREPDPAIREKLWDEYRKYKGIEK